MLNFNISQEVLDIGVQGAYLVISDLTNKKTDPEFDKFFNESMHEVISVLPDPITSDPILQGFRKLHEKVNVSNRKNLASPENLLKYILRTQSLPRVNLLVDIYNLVSVKTHLALGAHDISKINGNVNLRLTDGTEDFWPLGSPEQKKIRAGEYAYVDDNNDVICRLEVRQVEKTKVGLESKECFYIVQGNMATSPASIISTVNLLVELTCRFCGGSERILYMPQV